MTESGLLYKHYRSSSERVSGVYLLTTRTISKHLLE